KPCSAESRPQSQSFSAVASQSFARLDCTAHENPSLYSKASMIWYRTPGSGSGQDLKLPESGFSHLEMGCYLRA
ncbi:MAG TPA: hypothetical protein PLF85_14395, partial [Turneriella sp.]|nr:hypothetical protein [Turneriella sp.]